MYFFDYSICNISAVVILLNSINDDDTSALKKIIFTFYIST